MKPYLMVSSSLSSGISMSPKNAVIHVIMQVMLWRHLMRTSSSSWSLVSLVSLEHHGHEVHAKCLMMMLSSQVVDMLDDIVQEVDTILK